MIPFTGSSSQDHKIKSAYCTKGKAKGDRYYHYVVQFGFCWSSNPAKKIIDALNLIPVAGSIEVIPMPQTKTQQTDELSTLETSEVATFFNASVVPNDQLPQVFDREIQLQALRAEAERLQKAGWGTAINELTMEVDRWRPRGSFPCQQDGYLKKLGNLIRTYL